MSNEAKAVVIEKVREYIYANGATLSFPSVREVAQLENGGHRINFGDDEWADVNPGWLSTKWKKA